MHLKDNLSYLCFVVIVACMESEIRLKTDISREPILYQENMRVNHNHGKVHMWIEEHGKTQKHDKSYSQDHLLSTRPY